MFSEERTFTQGENRVRAVAEYDDDTRTVKRVVITHMDGKQPAVERMAAEIKTKYTGASYDTWKMGT